MARVDNRGNLRGSLQNQDLGIVGRAGSVKGANDFLALSKRLKAAGQRELRNELHAAVRRAGKPLPKKVKDAARANLPKRGGLNRSIAGKSYRVHTATGAKTAGVRVVGRKVDPRIDESGRVWHPVFGRKPGVVQQVPAAEGYFSDTLRESAPEVREAILDTLAQFRNRIVSRGL